MPKQNRAPRFDLSCWYINPQRVLQTLGSGNADLIARSDVGRASDFLSRGREVTLLEDALVAWLTANSIESLEKKLAKGELRTGSFVTTIQGFYHTKDIAGRTAKGEMRRSYHTYPEPFNTKLTCKYSTEHFTSSSSFATLRKRRRVMIIGYVGAMRRGEIELVPLAIADVVPKKRTGLFDYVPELLNYGELFPDAIDSFARIRKEPKPRKSELALLQKFPKQTSRRQLPRF